MALSLGVLLVAFAAPAAAQAAGIESFFASNCKVSTCKKVPPAEELEKAELEGYTQAGGHPNFGITDFTVDTTGTFPTAVPTGVVTHIRTDVAPGVATNPQSPTKCSFEEFEGTVLPGTTFYSAPACEASSEIGENKVVVYAGGDVPIEGKVYNLVQPTGLASDFGVALKLPKELTEEILSGTPYKGTPAETAQYYAHTFIEGNVEWGAEAAGTGKADYHDYFEIKVSPALPLISSRLVFKGRAGAGDFLTNPTSCTGVGPQTTTKLALTFEGGQVAEEKYSPPIGTSNCGIVPFEPGFVLTQGTTASEAPDGITTEFTLKHNTGPGEVDDSQVKTASVTLPEGITLDPSAAAGLEDCTPEQIGIGTKNPVTCPEGSRVGTVGLEVPGLPEGSLKGYAYLGGPAGAPISQPPYILYVAAESERYGVIVRLKGLVTPNESTGQLTTTFAENPEQPFTKLTIKLKSGPLAPLANSLKCEASSAGTVFTPFTNTMAVSLLQSFEVTGCPSALPFALTQSATGETPTAGGSTAYDFSLARPAGNQYLQKITTTLPSGLVGRIPYVTLCGEPQAAEGTCGAASQIGTATVTAGAGNFPFTFTGPVYMTGPYGSAPFGLSIAVPAVAGPFNLGTVVTRSAIRINETTARVTAETTLPTIVKGVPLRIRTLSVNVNRQGFLLNPTSCAAEATETTLTSTFGAAQEGLSSPFQLTECGALAFKPTFTATTSAHTSRQFGASLETTLNEVPGQANVKSVLVTLPRQLPSRLTTLQKACPEATFAANPYSCPEASMVGTARANTPTLRAKLTGPAYLVSHGGAQFPDLDLVLAAEGVKVILTGNTDIKNSITTTNFASTPDVPVSSITLVLPTGLHSALAAYTPKGTSLCSSPLYMPTVITGQNGVRFTQNTRIHVGGCGVEVVGHKVVGNTAYITVRTYAAGRISGTGSDLSSRYRTLRSAARAVSLKIPLAARGYSRRRPFHVRLRVGFVPRNHSLGNSVAYATLTFR